MPYARSLVFALVLIAVMISGRPNLAPTQTLTGDELSYVSFLRSFIEHGRFVMSLTEWPKLYAESTDLRGAGLPINNADVVLSHGIYLAVPLAPVSLLGLAALHVTSLLVGFTGLACLLPLCRRTGSKTAAVLATCIAGFSIPLLPYLHLFCIETFVFAIVSIGWWRLQTTARSISGDLLTACLLIVIPFVQLRGAVVAATLYGGLVWQVWSVGRRRRAAGLLAIAAAAFAVLLASNLAIHGAIAGPVDRVRPPMPLQWLGVLHRLLAYAPIWLLGCAGLVAGALRGSSLGHQGVVLAFGAAITGVGINPGECWPARSSMLSVPMLTVGLCLWWQMSRAWPLRGLTLALIALTLFNTAQFLLDPNSLLENRQAGTTDQLWSDRSLDWLAGTVLAVGASLFVAFAVAGALRRPAWAWGSVALLLAALDAAHVVLVAPARYRTDRQADRLTITIERPMRAGYVQIGRTWDPLLVSPPWPRFDVETDGAAGRFVHRTAARDVIPVSCKDDIRTITITTRSTIDLEAGSEARLNLYRSRSLIWRSVGWLRDRC